MSAASQREDERPSHLIQYSIGQLRLETLIESPDPPFVVHSGHGLYHRRRLGRHLVVGVDTTGMAPSGFGPARHEHSYLHHNEWVGDA